MLGDLPIFSCTVAFLISSRVGGSSISSFTSTWGILASDDTCTVRQSLKRPSKCSEQRWRMASFLSAGYVYPKSIEGLGSDVRVHRRPSMPRRRRKCHPCQYTVVSSRQVLFPLSFCMVLSLRSVLQAVLYAALAA